MHSKQITNRTVEYDDSLPFMGVIKLHWISDPLVLHIHYTSIHYNQSIKY